MQDHYSRFRTLAIVLLAAMLIGTVLTPASAFAGAATAPSEQNGQYHVVQRGETLSAIAQTYGVSVHALMQANMIYDPNQIYAGQRLVISADSAAGWIQDGMPGGMSDGMSGRMSPSMGAMEHSGDMSMDKGDVECRSRHTVQPGETGFDIARQYGVSTYSLVEANMLVDINTVYGGMKLCIPNTPYPVNEPSQPRPDSSKPEQPMERSAPMPESMSQPMPMPEQQSMPMWDSEQRPMPVTKGDCTYHMVRQGETLSDIAMVYGTNLYQLMKLNGISNPNKIYAGQALKVSCMEDTWMQQPEPMPMPMPEQRSMREPMPQQRQPMPEPMPMPEQRSMPEPMPQQRQPMPEPMPMPEQRSMPESMPQQRQPMPEPMPMPEQRSMPEPMAESMSMPPMGGHKGWMEVEQGPWWGFYYCDKYFGGEPVIMREDYDIRFNWYGHSPGHMVPEDRFSVMWKRIANLEGGWYRWRAVSDDGVRIYVDDQLVLDAWREQPATEYTADFYVTPGHHKFRVEYYEESNMASISVKLERR